MKSTIVFLAAFFSLLSLAHSQENPSPLSKAEKQQVVDSISRLLNDNYIFPEVAKEMTQLIQNNLSNGQYNKTTDPLVFSEQLTTDLQSISKDKHLRVRFAPEQIAEMRAHQATGDSEEVPQAWLDHDRRNNYGFKEVKILEGNIGYVDLRGFYDTQYGGETAVAAMNFLANTDALIIDLRQNGGGSPAMIQLLTSYFYNAEPVHLNNFYYRPTNENSQTWTLPHVPGKRRPDWDIYVLTSSNTFSAAEEFSYNLRNLERATLIGETTGGGAHPGGTEIATDRFTVWVPTGRAINPISGTNWEGTGVKPHIEVPASDALIVAQQKALEKLITKTTDENILFFYNWQLPILNAQTNPLTIKEAVLKSYAGSFGERQLFFENGKLYYQRKGRAKFELKALAEDLFMLEDNPNFRLKILKENGTVQALQGIYDDGRVDKSLKDRT